MLFAAVVLVGCSPGTPDSIAAWACKRIVSEGADPEAIIQAVSDEAGEAGISNETMHAALIDRCGVELGLVP